MHWDKTQMLEESPSDKINGTKMPSFFRELQLITVSLLIWDSYMSWFLSCNKKFYKFDKFDKKIDKFFKLRISKFWERQFFSIVTFE